MVCAITRGCDALKPDGSWGIAKVRWSKQKLFKTFLPYVKFRKKNFLLTRKNLAKSLPVSIITFFSIICSRCDNGRWAWQKNFTLTYYVIPDSNHLLGQRWHFVGSFVGPTSTNDVSPMSFCSSGQLNCQPLVRCWSNARSPTNPATCQRKYPTYIQHLLQ